MSWTSVCRSANPPIRDCQGDAAERGKETHRALRCAAPTGLLASVCSTLSNSPELFRCG